MICPMDTYRCTHTDLAQSWGKNEEEKNLSYGMKLKAIYCTSQS